MIAPHYSDLWQGIAARQPERPAVVTRDETVSWGRLAREAAAIAHHLRHERGLQPGEAAATTLYNRPEFLAFFWGCLAIGVAPVAINYRYRAGETRELLQDSACRALVFPTSASDVAIEAAAGLDCELIAVDDEERLLPGTVWYSDIVERGGSMPASAPKGAHLRLYTGGTTGSPKAVMWDLDTLLVARRNSTWGLIGVEPPAGLEGAVDIACDESRPQLRTLPVSPLLHGTAQSATMATLAIGGCVVLHASPRSDIDEVVRLARDAKATRLILAGDVLALPIAEAAARAGGLPDVTSVISSGMRLSEDAKTRLHALGDMTVVDMFASSEGGPYALATTTGANDLPSRFVMTPDAVILDEDLEDITDRPGALGLVAFRGVLPNGYWNDPVKTASSFPTLRGRKHLVPGDWVQRREDGSIELLGRGGAVVNTGGEKVFPAEVEAVLIEHPSVADAVVFGLQDAKYGEVVCAAVAPVDGAEIDPDEIVRAVGEQLAGYKKPRHVLVRPSLDRTSTGKINFEGLRREALGALVQ